MTELHNYSYLKDLRRGLRQKQTSSEEILWEAIRNSKLGVKFKRQHSIGHYIVDFYCASKQLVIEVDGGIHDTADQIEKDRERDENLMELKFKISRIRNEEVKSGIGKVILKKEQF